MGRKMKPLYRKLIESLEADVLYTPAMIVDRGIQAGVVENFGKLVRRKIRHNFARRAHLAFGPPDGHILRGNAIHRAWLGKNWQALLQVNDESVTQKAEISA